MNELEDYLKLFKYGKEISNPNLWKEMDRVWDNLNLNNTKKLSDQKIGDFYAHPVWVLNGLFSENDIYSYRHREQIVKYTQNYFNEKLQLNIADFGGGSGVLGKIFENNMPNISQIDIIEPWPSPYFLNKLSGYKKIKFTDNFKEDNFYELVIAQDVLEHIENPIETAINCFNATKDNGLIIFANCFYPVIKCHLPGNFHLRHLFKFVVTSNNLKYLGKVTGTDHIEVYLKKAPIKFNFKIKLKILVAKFFGPVLNYSFNTLIKIKSLLK